MTPWTAARQASLSFTISRSLPKLMSIESAMPSSHLILCHSLFLLPSVFSSIRVFSNELPLCIRWTKYWSFSFIISQYSGLVSLGFTGWISMLFKVSQESSLAQKLKIISSLALSLLYGPTLTSIYNYWKNHSLDYMYLCWQSDVSVF